MKENHLSVSFFLLHFPPHHKSQTNAVVRVWDKCMLKGGRGSGGRWMHRQRYKEARFDLFFWPLPLKGTFLLLASSYFFFF